MKLPGFNVATIIFAAAIMIATTLVTILVRNPATHANLEDPEFYDRTELAYLNSDYTYSGYGRGSDLADSGADPHLIGRALYVRSGCVGCHGIYAQGATIGETLWDIDSDELSDVIREIRDGPGGMPAYPEGILSNEDLDLILSYLAGAQADATAVGVTTTTTTTTTLPPTTTTTAGPDVTTDPSTTTTIPGGTTERTVEAPSAAITIDGNTSDWDGVIGLDLTLESIVGEGAPSHAASIKVAHDDEFIYVLFEVEDDFNWSEIDPHFAGAPAVMWPIESAAGPHMGADDPAGEPTLGMVDIWYWRLDCPIGEEQGGAVSGPGRGDPGNDDACNFDDEWATDPETHEDDIGPGAENSLLGVFTHSNPVEDAAGRWFFEMRRPLQTGDDTDAQFEIGRSTRLALAYWDPDAGQNGWGRRDHVQSSNGGWINVILEG